MRRGPPTLFIAAFLFSAGSSAQSTSKTVEPTKAQTEEWLREHIEAWNEADIHVTAKDCRIAVLDKPRERTEIIDLNGLLLPIEIIDLGRPVGDSNVTVRLRVKQKHSGRFSMFRSCNAANGFCADSTGKFHNQPFIDFTITSVRDYSSSSRSTNLTKAERLERALDHYARLCGAMEDARNRLF